MRIELRVRSRRKNKTSYDMKLCNRDNLYGTEETLREGHVDFQIITFSFSLFIYSDAIYIIYLFLRHYFRDYQII